MGTNERAFLTHSTLLAWFDDRMRERYSTTAFQMQKASTTRQAIAEGDTLQS